jgi:hypothetical protein
VISVLGVMPAACIDAIATGCHARNSAERPRGTKHIPAPRPRLPAIVLFGNQRLVSDYFVILEPFLE